MRRFLSVLLLCCSLTLVGARSRPAPSPTPSPSPAPTAAPALPSVIVYPFSVSGDTDKSAGVKIAQLLATQLHEHGRVEVKLPQAGVTRAQYLADATKSSADYYVSGYLTPLGEQIAIVEQVVSTTSGAIIWSNTAQVTTYADALSQGDLIQTAILSHAGRVEARYQQQESAATPAPEDRNGTSTSIGRILGIFKKGPAATPAPRTTLSAAQKAPRAIYLVPLSNATASHILLDGLQRYFIALFSPVLTSNAQADAKRICNGQSNIDIATGSFSSVTRYRRESDSFTLRVLLCDGSTYYTTTTTANTAYDAINNAIDAFYNAHPRN